MTLENESENLLEHMAEGPSCSTPAEEPAEPIPSETAQDSHKKFVQKLWTIILLFWHYIFYNSCWENQYRLDSIDRDIDIFGLFSVSRTALVVWS